MIHTILPEFLPTRDRESETARRDEMEREIAQKRARRNERERERERERGFKISLGKLHSLSLSLLFFYFYFYLYSFSFLFTSKILDGPDRLRYSRRVQGRPSPRFTGFTYLMFLHQIVTKIMVVAGAQKMTSLYIMQVRGCREEPNVVDDDSSELWHKRLCHMSLS